eukprot:312339-Pleurochrysis_carterae.AAC.2
MNWIELNSSLRDGARWSRKSRLDPIPSKLKYVVSDVQNSYYIYGLLARQQGRCKKYTCLYIVNCVMLSLRQHLKDRLHANKGTTLKVHSSVYTAKSVMLSLPQGLKRAR